MKVYTLPDEVPAPKVDYFNYDREKAISDEAAHKEALKAWLKEHGYNGKHTGRIAQFGVADGYAQYMMADGPKSCLIHLPYGDAYQYFGINHFPKKQVIEMMDADDNFRKLFKK